MESSFVASRLPLSTNSPVAATSNRSLVERAQRLDPDAFDEITDAFTARLYGFFHRMLGRQADAEDLVQEVFIRVVRTITDYRDDGRFEGWLFKIAGNLARDRIRRDRGAPQLADGQPQVRLREVADSRSDVETLDGATTRGEELDDLQRLLERLPAVEREVVLMRHFGGLSFQEIAEYTDSPLGTVLSRAHRGLTKLRGWVEPQK